MRSGASFIIFLGYTLRRLWCERRGASAVEFALVVPALLIGIFGILEIAFMFLATQVLEMATQDTTRLVMTGQVKSSTVTKDAFKTMVCDKAKVLLDCSKLYVDAQAFTSMSEPKFPNPIEDKKFVDNTQFITGKQGDIVVVRTFYAWPVFIPGLLGYNQSNLDGGTRLLTASAAIRNEPW